MHNLMSLLYKATSEIALLGKINFSWDGQFQLLFMDNYFNSSMGALGES